MINLHAFFKRFYKLKNNFYLENPDKKCWPDSPLKRLGLLNQGFNGIKYNLNSRGYRCDEFTNIHNNKHILFSGCSITAGHSIDIENSWSFLLHQYIEKIYKTSGYFNIAISGQSISEIIFSIFKYCNEFGNPEEIYIRDLANDYLESCGLYQNKDRFVIELWRYRCFGDKTSSPFPRHKDSFGLILAPINTCIFYIRKDTTVIGGDLELFGLPPYGRLISKPIKKINTDDCKVFAFDGNVIHRVTSMSGFGNRDCIVVQFEKKV
mgnify:CR=1 FL=1